MLWSVAVLVMARNEFGRSLKWPRHPFSLNNHLAVTLLSVQFSSLLLVTHRQDVERNKGTYQALSLVFAPPFSFIQ